MQSIFQSLLRVKETQSKGLDARSSVLAETNKNKGIASPVEPDENMTLEEHHIL